MSARDPAFDAWIESARAVTVQAELMRRGLWSRAMLGDNGVACPGCGGRDRFAVNLRKNVWNCRASGAAGDAIALAMHIDGTDFLAAVETVTGAPPPARASRLTERERQEIAARAEQAHRNAEAKRRAAEKSSARFRERERRAAHEIWMMGLPIAGTRAEAYLALRGLSAPSGAKLRCCHLPYWDKPKEQGGIVVHEGPVLVAAIAGPDGRFAGVHRTWIDSAQPNGKAIIVHPKTGEILPAKKVRGSVKGGSILLAKYASPPVRLFLGEGIETVLAVHCAMQALGLAVLHDAEFRSGVSLGNLAGRAAGRVRHPTETRIDKRGRKRPHFGPDNEPAADDDWPMISVPASVRELVLLGDSDSEPFFTRLALERAGKRFACAYPWLLIRLASAAPGKDFNDMWRPPVEGAAA